MAEGMSFVPASSGQPAVVTPLNYFIPASKDLAAMAPNKSLPIREVGITPPVGPKADSGKLDCGHLTLYLVAGAQRLLVENLNWQVSVPLDEGRESSFRLIHHLDFVEPCQDLFPEDPQLKFSQAISHAAMDTETE